MQDLEEISEEAGSRVPTIGRIKPEEEPKTVVENLMAQSKSPYNKKN